MRSEETGARIHKREGAARSFTLARTPVPRWLPACEACGNGYRICRECRRRRICHQPNDPWKFRLPRSRFYASSIESLSLSLSLSFSFFFLFIRTHGHTRAHEGTRYSVQIIAEIRTRSEMEMEKQRLLPELEELGEGGKSCSYTRTVDIKAYSEWQWCSMERHGLILPPFRSDPWISIRSTCQ